MSILSLKGISKQFRGTSAVHDITLSIESGEFFSILGPSGCGKTTLLRMIAGFESPGSGTIFLNDRNITSMPPQDRGIGMVFQNYALFPHMTVFQNVAFGLETKGVAKEKIRSRVENILDAVRLRNKINTPVPQLSGGEQQRVAVARALVVEPDVLLFDEPLSSLDVALRLSTREEIRALQRRTGTTTIYVTHDQSEAMSLSDRIAVMHAGRIVQVGSPSEMYEHPATTFVAEFLGGANIIHGHYDGSSRQFSVDSFTTSVPPGMVECSGSVSVAIKPEAIAFEDGTQREPNTFQAKIVEKEFLGFTTLFIIDVDGLTLRMTVLSTEKVRRCVPGRMVSVRFNWSGIRIFPE